jgi:hypothetical protein
MTAVRDVASLAPGFRQDAQSWIAQLEKLGVQVKVTRARASRFQQARLYREFLAAKAAGIPHLPAAPPGHSQHEKGLAFDMVVTGGPVTLDRLGQAWASAGQGRRWGGAFSDPVHFDWGLR